MAIRREDLTEEQLAAVDEYDIPIDGSGWGSDYAPPLSTDEEILDYIEETVDMIRRDKILSKVSKELTGREWLWCEVEYLDPIGTC